MGKYRRGLGTLAAFAACLLTTGGAAAQVPDNVRKEATSRHADAYLGHLLMRLKDNGEAVETTYLFFSKGSGDQIQVVEKAGKLQVTVAQQPGGDPLPATFPGIKEALVEARKQGLVGGYKGPGNEDGLITASLLLEERAPVWRIFGADAAGKFVSAVVTGAKAPVSPDELLTERVPPTPENVARVLKQRVGPDAAGVAVRVSQNNGYVMTVTGRVPHAGVKLKIRWALTHWTDAGEPTFNDRAVMVPQRLPLVGALPALQVDTGNKRAAFSQDGRRVASWMSGRAGGRAVERADVVEVASRRTVLSYPVPVLSNPRETTNLQLLALTPDGEGGAVYGKERDGPSAVLFFGRAENKPVTFDPTVSITGLAIGPGGKVAAAGAASGAVYLIRNGVKAEVPVQPTYAGACNWLLALSPDGQRLAVGERETGFVTVHDVATGAQAHRVTQKLLSVTALAWSGDSRWLAVGSNDRDGIVVLDATTGTSRVLAGVPGLVTALALAPDGARLASAHLGTGVGLWDVASGQLVNALEYEYTGDHLIGFADNGRTLLTGVANQSQEIRRWDLGNRTPAAAPAPLGGATAILSAAGAPDKTGDLSISVEYRIAGAVGKDCTLVVSFRDAAGKPVPAKSPDRRGSDGNLSVSATVRPDADPYTSYRQLLVPKGELPPGTMTAAVNVYSGNRWLLERSYVFEIKAP